MSKIKYILIGIGIILLFLLSEALFVFSHKWILYSYLLRSAKMPNGAGATGAAFFVATEGKYSLVNDLVYKNDVSEDLKSVPANFNLPAVLYEFSVSASDDRLNYLVPELLGLSIKMDPDFSFWRIELANYYLLNGDTAKSKSVLDDCLKLQYPRQHCQTYVDSFFVSNEPQKVGFLESDVKKIYQEKTF